MSKTILKKAFFNRPADVVARELIGHILCVDTGGSEGVVRLMINETEAYMGPHDLACHAAKGRTTRTEMMYGRAGTLYVYFVYGMYWMFNVVTGAEGYPAAVLIRGAGEYDGPGKFTKALGITKVHNGKRLGKASCIWIEGSQVADINSSQIRTTPRIGIAYAGEWTKKPLRFVLEK